jgi:hypothetical protein
MQAGRHNVEWETGSGAGEFARHLKKQHVGRKATIRSLMTFRAYAVGIVQRYLDRESPEGGAKKKPHDIGHHEKRRTASQEESKQGHPTAPEADSVTAASVLATVVPDVDQAGAVPGQSAPVLA